jgi:hypothetical protein
MSDEMDERYRVTSDNHAFRTGQVLGVAMAAGLDVEPVVDAAGNYTAAFDLRSDRLPEGVTVRLIVEAPVEASEPVGVPALDPDDAEMVADELRALGWQVSPPPVPPATDPSWLVERDDGGGFEMLGGGRDE